MSQSLCTTVSAVDAGMQFTDLIDRVAGGEEVLITQNGSPVVRMTPVGQPRSETERRTAVIAMRKLAERHQLNGLTLRDLIAEGRR
ncbi:MAG TPA: type II toxin-antitoxin system prevent-host-death family antitoxin [Planctomycetaceae bacterium]|nr:type II toxin-antitoxin system prevent-host-death family antitoxin [Planctomycetaceae bacterium]